MDLPLPLRRVLLILGTALGVGAVGLGIGALLRRAPTPARAAGQPPAGARSPRNRASASRRSRATPRARRRAAILQGRGPRMPAAPPGLRTTPRPARPVNSKRR